jgi:hypothetical protein
MISSPKYSLGISFELGPRSHIKILNRIPNNYVVFLEGFSVLCLLIPPTSHQKKSIIMSTSLSWSIRPCAAVEWPRFKRSVLFGILTQFKPPGVPFGSIRAYLSPSFEIILIELSRMNQISCMDVPGTSFGFPSLLNASIPTYLMQEHIQIYCPFNLSAFSACRQLEI